MNDGSFDAAVTGCWGVVHAASPFFFKDGSEDTLVQPAVTGTRNVLNSIATVGGDTVTSVVVTSSMAAVVYGHDGETYTEGHWSDEAMLRDTEQWYQLSKTLAEREVWAWRDAQGALNTSSGVVLGLMTGAVAPRLMGFVDIRDTARAHVLAVLRSCSSGHRYLCFAESLAFADAATTLAEMYPRRCQPFIPHEGNHQRRGELTRATC